METSQTFKPYMVRCECVWCGNAFYAKRRDTKYCTTSHKLKHQRWRNNLYKQQHEALVRIENISSYLGHADTTETAVHELTALKNRIDEMLNHAKVSKVK